MHHIDEPSGCFRDRVKEDPQVEPIDVIMLTLDAENFLEKSLYTVFREIPVSRLIICDGGSKDKTLEILKKFPRVELHVKPDLKTTGKALEYLISLTNTEWFVLVDSDIELGKGWYDEMKKYQSKYDVIENSKSLLGYHFYREDTEKLEENSRAQDQCHLIKKSAMKNYHCDDDFMWRFTDYLIRQVSEDAGYKYGKASTTHHIHHETERIPYSSDSEKNFSKIVFTEPKVIVTDKDKARLYDIKHAKAVVKYLDPNHKLIKKNKNFNDLIKILDRKWIEENGPKWLERYDKGSSMNLGLKKFVKKKLLKKSKR